MNERVNLKILYVEDEPETRFQMEKFLKRRFSRVISAPNGIEGLKRFNEESPDIVIADLLMEKLGGIEMLEKIREAGSGCPVVITSALEDSSSIIRTVDIGIVKYIIKPIDTEELSNTLEKISADLLRENKRKSTIGIDEKKDIENNLRLSLSAFLKRRTGRGPRRITPFIGEDRLEISISGFLTAFDESLMSDLKNQAVVEQNRRLFYSTVKADITDLIGSYLSGDVRLGEITVNAAEDREKIIFHY